MTDKAGWEVEGFIDRLTRRDDSNSERLVAEAISHLRWFSRDCDALRESNQELRAEIAKLGANIAHVAGFIEGMADRIKRWVRWDNGEGDVGSFTMAAEDCRAMAASLKRKWKLP